MPQAIPQHLAMFRPNGDDFSGPLDVFGECLNSGQRVTEMGKVAKFITETAAVRSRPVPTPCLRCCSGIWVFKIPDGPSDTAAAPTPCRPQTYL